jgi:hypothetical protein
MIIFEGREMVEQCLSVAGSFLAPPDALFRD